jgi:hypothetical protein
MTIGKITNGIRKLEKADGRMCLPPEFVKELKLFVLGYASQGMGEISIENFPFRANPIIANVVIEGGCEAILSGDSDFVMYIGPGGPDKLWDIMLRDIKVNQK